jgi:hypothetical protein
VSAPQSPMRLLLKLRSSIHLLILLAFLGGASAIAQDLDNATITGKVADQNGAVIPGATVKVTLANTKTERTVVSDGDGNYKIIQLAPGKYTLEATANSFQPTVMAELEFIGGRNAQIDIVLLPPGIKLDTVVVTTDDASPVDVTRTVVGNTVKTREIESLPVASRSPLDLIFTMGGAAEEPLSVRDLATDSSKRTTPEEAGNFSISGGTAYSNNITIDGLDNNDDRSAKERFTPSMDAVDEVQIIRNQFAAEYGRASGGRINLRTRGGANKFRAGLLLFS